jgi:hypothetical protein
MQRSNNISILAFLGMGFMAILVGLVTAVGGGIPMGLLLVLLLGMVMLMRDFRFGTAILVLMMPLAATAIMPRQLLGITGLNPFNLILIATLAAALLVKVFGREPTMPLPWRFFLPLLALLVIGTYIGSSKVPLISPHFYMEQVSLYRTATEYVRDEFAKPLLTFAAIWLVGLAVSRSKAPERWLTLFGWSVIALPVMVVAAVLHSGLSLRELASPLARTVLSVTGLHANDFSVMLLPAFAAALFMLPTHKSKGARLFGLLVVGATLVGLLLTFSRAAFLGVLLVTAIFFFLRGNFRYIFFGCLFFAVVALSLPDAFIERATTGMASGHVGGRNDALTAGRVGGIWMPLLPEIGKHILLGDGINSTIWSLPSRQGVFAEGHPHNAYLRLLKDHGLLGVPLIVYFLLQVWRLYRRLSNDERMTPTVRAFYQGISVAYVIFFIQCMSGSRLLFSVQQVFYWLAIAIGLGLEYAKSREAAPHATAADVVR